MNLFQFFRSTIKVSTMVATLSLACSNVASAYYSQYFANHFYQIGQILSCYTLDCGHWYVGANVGISAVHDEKQPGLGSSVNQTGPGWGALLGYQFNSILGTELGFTQYHHSRETIGNPFGGGSVTLATTEHYAAYLAATGRYPLGCKFSALGKLGYAYSYANKIFNVLGFSASSGAGSLYWGLGVAYSVTPKVDLIAQFARARGNHYTGSSDLWSLGATFAIV